MKKLLYQLEKDYVCYFKPFLKEEEIIEFEREVTEEIIFRDSEDHIVMTIQPSFHIIVHEGYRWDGCSPKCNILDLFWIGTPDGIVIGSERITDYASVVHDVLGYCKNRPEMPSLFRAHNRDLWLSPGRKSRDMLFFHLLKEKKFLFRHLYYVMTALFGPLHEWMQDKTFIMWIFVITVFIVAYLIFV